MGRRVDQRHLCATAGVALAEADGGAAAAAGATPAWPAGGGRAVVACGAERRRLERRRSGRERRRRPGHGAAPLSIARAARTPRRADPGGGRRRRDRGRVQRRLPGAAGDGGIGADPPRLLRRRAGRGPVRPAWRRGQTAVPARVVRRSTGRPDRPSPRRCRPGESVWRRALMAAPRRLGSAAVTTGGRRVRGPRGGTGSALPGTRRALSADAVRDRR